jgi:hypothetical protein
VYYMATKEQSMRKWIYSMNKYELQHLEKMVNAAQERLARIETIEHEARMRGE